ncbi:unnamed protein product [Arctogadus glacialis]
MFRRLGFNPGDSMTRSNPNQACLRSVLRGAEYHINTMMNTLSPHTIQGQTRQKGVQSKDDPGLWTKPCKAIWVRDGRVLLMSQCHTQVPCRLKACAPQSCHY